MLQKQKSYYIYASSIVSYEAVRVFLSPRLDYNFESHGLRHLDYLTVLPFKLFDNPKFTIR